jgi:hypothetical protein
MPTKYAPRKGPNPTPKICKKPPKPMPPPYTWPLSIIVTAEWAWSPATPPPPEDILTNITLHDTGYPNTWEGASNPDYPKLIAEVSWDPPTKTMRLELQYWTDGASGTIEVLQNLPYDPVPGFCTPLLSTAPPGHEYTIHARIFTA